MEGVDGDSLFSPTCCAACGALTVPGRRVCWLCGAGESLDQAESTLRRRLLPRKANPAGAAVRRCARSQRNNALAATVVLLLVVYGAASMSPAAGIVLAILAAPAFVHTAIFGMRRGSDNKIIAHSQSTLGWVGIAGLAVALCVSWTIVFYCVIAAQMAPASSSSVSQARDRHQAAQRSGSLPVARESVHGV